MTQLISPITKLNEPEREKRYIILYYATVDDGEEVKEFKEVEGRLELYKWIKTIIESLDIHRSKVLLEGAVLDLDKAPSVYELMTHFQTMFNDTTFDIEDYNIGDID